MSDPRVNEQGFVIDYKTWDQAFAQQVAGQEKLQLTEAHWQVLFFCRDFYQSYHRFPGQRVLLKGLVKKFGPPFDSSIALRDLFPGGPRQIAQLAGLPKPAQCI